MILNPYRHELIQVAAVAVAALEDERYGSTETSGEAFSVKLLSVLADIWRERKNQEQKWGPQHHTPEEWLTILVEEVGETARAILEK